MPSIKLRNCFPLGGFVILKSDAHKERRLVIAINIKIDGSYTYGVAKGESTYWACEEECEYSEDENEKRLGFEVNAMNAAMDRSRINISESCTPEERILVNAK